MAELAAAAVPELLRPEQAAQHYSEAVRTAVAACAEDTAGQRCYICYGESDEDEGLVSGFCACRGGLSFAHVSCLARGAQAAVQRGVQNWKRWHTCGLCEQAYHGVVACALGWGCWKTYVGRPETDQILGLAMNLLGNGLAHLGHHEDALSVKKAELSMLQRVGASERRILIVQSNLATTYDALGRLEDALSMHRDVYSGRLRLQGEEHVETCLAAFNYASTLVDLQHFEEAKSLLRKTMPVARRVFGESHELTLTTRRVYAVALHQDPDATLDDLREAVATLEDAERIARRVFGGQHPFTVDTERGLRLSRAKLRAREDAEPDVSAQELDAAEAEAAAAVAAAAIKKRQRQDTIERERSRRRTG
jgi:tetratricopeptide (TPR) repeat protein